MAPLKMGGRGKRVESEVFGGPRWSGGGGGEVEQAVFGVSGGASKSLSLTT